MKKVLTSLVIVVLVVAAASGWLFAFLWRAEVQRTLGRNADLSDRISALEDDLAAARIDVVVKEEAVARAKASAAAIESQVHELETSRDALAEEIGELEEALTDLSDERDGLRTRIEDQRSTIWELANEIAKLGKFASCNVETDPNMDYTEHKTASESLREFLEPMRGEVVDARWQVAWTDARMVIHSLASLDDDERVTDVFVVYMPGDGGHSGVYWLNETCFLELPD
jgi:hypothetical protein